MPHPTHIAEGTRVEGEIFDAAVVEVAGTVDGAIVASEKVTILASGSVIGPIYAPQITIEGSLSGAASATRAISVTASAKVVGNLRAPDVSVAPGAEVDGRVEPVAPRLSPLTPTRIPVLPRGEFLARPRLVDVGESSPPRKPAT